MQSWCSPLFFRTFSVSWILDLWASSYIFTCILVCLYRISWSRLSQNCTQKTLPSYDACDHHIFPPANKPHVGTHSLSWRTSWDSCCKIASHGHYGIWWSKVWWTFARSMGFQDDEDGRVLAVWNKDWLHFQMLLLHGRRNSLWNGDFLQSWTSEYSYWKVL
jgi:hypothetical protein